MELPYSNSGCGTVCFAIEAVYYEFEAEVFIKRVYSGFMTVGSGFRPSLPTKLGYWEEANDNPEVISQSQTQS